MNTMQHTCLAGAAVEPQGLGPFTGARALCVAALATLLAACGTPSRVSDQGTTEQPVFPDPARLTRPATQNTAPQPELLRALAPGMGRDQVYAHIGPPHFAEGFRVREWDYAFTLPQAAGGTRTCQLKVLFDKDRIARSFLWQPANCAPA